jgi:beta-glucosidase
MAKEKAQHALVASVLARMGAFAPGGVELAVAVAVSLSLDADAQAQDILYAQDQGQAAAQVKVVNGPWMNPKRSPDARADAALGAMTREEKIAIINAAPLGVPRLGVPAVKETDASLGVANIGNMRKGFEATALPASLLAGSSWDPALARSGGAMVGAEARGDGFGVLLGGGANLIRDPRAGRNFEYFSEDPLLTGVLAGQAVAGVQSNRIVSTLKHFAFNNQETGRAVYSVEIDEKAMRETELLAFEIADEIGKPGSVMCSYNRVNAVYACENKFLLVDVLRRDWGFQGFVMSDWGGVHSTESLVNGLDKKSGGNIDTKLFFSKELEPKLASGEIPFSAVDRAVRRILRTMFASGLVDDPPSKSPAIDHQAHARVAQDQAEGGIVLLKNEGDLLPLASSVARIAVIGGHADVGVLSGGGSSQVVPVGGLALEIKHKGPIRRSYGGTPPLNALRAAFPNTRIDYVDGQDVAAATALAASADLVIVFAEKWSNESDDQADMSLDGDQDRLIDAVATANPRTIVVLETGNPVSMPWRDKTPAILATWYPGQRGGDAIANIVSGKVNPSGHLPVTWPAGLDQLPLPKLAGSDVPRANGEVRRAFGYQADRMPFTLHYPEGSDVGYRWFDKKGLKPLYPFGHGLSYTRFAFSDLGVAGGKQLTVRFKVTNTGTRAGADVPQVYVLRDGMAKRLIGWAKPSLKPGETQMVSITADPRLLGDFDVKQQRWVVPAGDYRIEVGSSAADPVLSGGARLAGRKVKP